MGGQDKTYLEQNQDYERQEEQKEQEGQLVGCVQDETYSQPQDTSELIQADVDDALSAFGY